MARTVRDVRTSRLTVLLVGALLATAGCGGRPRSEPGPSPDGGLALDGALATDGARAIDGAPELDASVDGGGGAGDAEVEIDAGPSGGPRLTWAVRPTGAEYGARMAIASDSAGNVVVANGSRVFAYDASGRERWTYTLSGTTTSISDVAIDRDGNVLVAGGFFNVTIDGRHLTSAGSSDILLLSLGPTGAYRWHRTWGTTDHESVSRVGVDDAGNAYLVGQGTDGSLEIGGAPIDGWEPITPGVFGTPPLWDISSFLVSIDAAGAQRWSRAIDGLDTRLADMAVRPDGALTLAGIVLSTVDLGAGAMGAPTGGSDAFVARYSALGACRWSRRIDAAGYASVFSVGVDAGGNAYLAALMDGRVSGMVIESGMPSVVALDPTGATRWERSYAVRALEVSHVVGPRVLVTGHHYAGVDFGDGLHVPRGYDDAFVLSLRSDGALDWSLAVADRSSDQGLAVLGEASGDGFWMAGTVDLFEADFGTGPLPEVATGPDLFVARGTAR